VAIDKNLGQFYETCMKYSVGPDTIEKAAVVSTESSINYVN
jgi:hypothetical protein